MLELITGKPGNGKTLYMIKRAHEEYVQADPPRPVYYYNIEGVTLEGFHKLENPHEWMKCPAGALIIIDEVHKVWPQRTKGDPPPSAVELAEHRHYGIDLLVATQDPADLDIFARRRCGRHRHFVRPFEAGHARHFEWQNVVMDPFDRFEQKKAVEHNFKLDPKYFGTYESTAQDTHKRKLPWKKLAPVAAAGVVAVGLVWFVVDNIAGWGDVGRDQQAEQINEAADRAANAADLASRAAASAAASVEAIRQQFEEVVEGLPWSAPFYGDLVKPQTVPVVAGCSLIRIGSKHRCSCTDQYGEPVKVTSDQCIEYVRNGFPFDWSGERRAALAAEQQRLNAAKGGGGGSVTSSSRGDGAASGGAPAPSLGGGARAADNQSPGGVGFPF
ncbi:MAG: zonular occludens toxin domain-containing protein [Algiphilus sp.]|uniref:zonular occludens toxin domain-containing protein n=1 Tax=Algiphilus sp. TaxID=1872431 RepID=UPI0032EE526A